MTDFSVPSIPLFKLWPSSMTFSSSEHPRRLLRRRQHLYYELFSWSEDYTVCNLSQLLRSQVGSSSCSFRLIFFFVDLVHGHKLYSPILLTCWTIGFLPVQASNGVSSSKAFVASSFSGRRRLTTSLLKTSSVILYLPTLLLLLLPEYNFIFQRLHFAQGFLVWLAHAWSHFFQVITIAPWHVLTTVVWSQSFNLLSTFNFNLSFPLLAKYYSMQFWQVQLGKLFKFPTS